LHLFVRGQFFDLLNDFKRTHGLIIRQNLFLASRIALRSGGVKGLQHCHIVD
jgi:hypothetical protein